MEKLKVGFILKLKDILPIYLLLIEEIYKGIFKCLVFTEDISLAVFNEGTPILFLEKENKSIAELPLWIYGTKDLLLDYAEPIGEVYLNKLSIEKLISYAEETPIPEAEQGEYINSIARALSSLNTASLFEYLDALEEAVDCSPDQV